ncbi:hypothetical protein [Shinella sp. JR1-6]|uniref:hypothetical protein n=1 Tax=Shinella sp. JR1-6 TaxID=2527671 RepID=UPI00102D627A|nr:hypothetical protein [Shinella sp. JR1-6]TAA49791.1 hypothetical protein EXZ48_33890 [Shinella sp. JR1-6]
MSYPSVTSLRQHALHARMMAEEYRSEGRFSEADRREADAEFYMDLAHREEWRLLQKLNTTPEGIAA